jgi:hypothetical protein
MSDESKIETRKQHDLFSIIQKINRELNNVEKVLKEKHRQLILRQFKELKNALRESAEVLACTKAKLRFENSQDIVNTMISDVKNYSQVVDFYKSDLFDRRKFAEFVQTIRMLERLGYEIDDHGGKVPLPNSPIITSCPKPITTGQEYTLLGTRFGSTTGEIRIEAKTEPAVINPTIINWSDTAVRFIIPYSVKIPFNAQGTLTLKRLAPITETNYWTDDPTTTVNVELVTRNIFLFFSTDEYSDSGHSNNPLYNYEKNIILYSSLLPEVYQFFTSDFLDSDGLLIKHYDNKSLYLESGSTVELKEGPYESQNSLQVKLKITDDWYWDYSVYAEFYILVPEGYDIPNGWMHN